MLLGRPFEGIAQPEKEPLVAADFCPGYLVCYRRTCNGGAINANGVEQGVHVVVFADLLDKSGHAPLEKHHTQYGSLKREREANQVLRLEISMRFYVSTVFRGPRIQDELLGVWSQGNIIQPFELIKGVESNCDVFRKSIFVKMTPIEVTDHQLVKLLLGDFCNEDAELVPLLPELGKFANELAELFGGEFSVFFHGVVSALDHMLRLFDYRPSFLRHQRHIGLMPTDLSENAD